MSKEEDIRESNEANTILNSEVFKKAIKELEKEYVTAWKNANSVEERELLYSAVTVLPFIEKHLRIILDKGTLAKSQIQNMKGILK